MPRLVVAAVMGLSLWAVTRPAEARVDIAVDLGAQTMRVSTAEGDYVWPISSARMGYDTPRGTFSIKRLEAMHRSHKYHNSPMPHSMFFAGGYAIHGTYETSALGEPASHGCIRLAPGDAAQLYRMVAAEGGRVTIAGNPPGSGAYASRLANTRYAAARHHRRDRPEDMDDDDALGYAPARRPGIGQWLEDPSDPDDDWR